MRAELRRYGIPRRDVAALARRFLSDGEAQKILLSRADDGTYSIDVRLFDVARDLLEAIAQGAAVQLQGETDAPVTTDIHRLIRLPGSLHGGTGFRVVPLAREAVDAFDPFRDALLGPIDGPTQRVTFTETVEYPFPGGVRGSPGQTDELATPVALFLLLRREAELPPSPA